MSKAIVVIEEPTNCLRCDLCDTFGECTIRKTPVPLGGARPEWCPLKRMPEPNKDFIGIYGYQDGFADGWNSCLSKIGGIEMKDIPLPSCMVEGALDQAAKKLDRTDYSMASSKIKLPMKTTVGKWNYETHQYDPYELPEGAEWYCDDMNKVVACAGCGKKIRFGDGYTSRRIHVPRIGMGYAICTDCSMMESLLEEMYGGDKE